MKRRGEKGFAPNWHFKVKRVADVAVTAYREMIVIATENFSQWSCEKWAWRVNLIKNSLIEINILPWPIPSKDNWFTRIQAAPQQILDTKGELMKMKFIIGKIMPMGWNPIGLMDIQIDSKDWIPFETSSLVITEPCKAPLMKNLEKNYRVALDPEPTKTPTQDKNSKPRLSRRKKSETEGDMHVTRKTRKRISANDKTEKAKTIVLSDSEVKPKKMKQQKLENLKKVYKNFNS